jgi:hypothetical protein
MYCPMSKSNPLKGHLFMKQPVYGIVLIALCGYIIYRLYNLYAALPLKVPSQINPV